jgi:hypothetical protein
MFGLNELIFLLGCLSQVYTYLSQFQIITGIDVISLLVNNQLNPALINLIIHTVSSNAVNMTTEISLSDRDLWDLLSYVISVSNGNIISAELLDSLGLYNNSIVAYLISFGFRIL